MRKKSYLSLICLGAIMSLPWRANAQDAAKSEVGPVEVSAALQSDVSPALRDIPGKERASAPHW